jgi:hypothetical protein
MQLPNAHFLALVSLSSAILCAWPSGTALSVPKTVRPGQELKDQTALVGGPPAVLDLVGVHLPAKYEARVSYPGTVSYLLHSYCICLS